MEFHVAHIGGPFSVQFKVLPCPPALGSTQSENPFPCRLSSYMTHGFIFVSVDCLLSAVVLGDEHSTRGNVTKLYIT